MNCGGLHGMHEEETSRLCTSVPFCQQIKLPGEGLHLYFFATTTNTKKNN
jgi:hypothetical protein